MNLMQALFTVLINGGALPLFFGGDENERLLDPGPRRRIGSNW